MEDQMTHDETLLQVPGQKSGYFQGKGDGKKAPIKRMQENMREEVQNSLREFKETTLKTMREKLTAELKDEVRAEIKNEVRAEVIEEIREEVTSQVGKDLERKFDMMFANKMAAIFGSFSQSGGSN